MDAIFREQPYLSNVYPGDTRDLAGIVFQIKDGEIEYFNLGVHPIFRESYPIGRGHISRKGYQITDNCIGSISAALNRELPIRFSRNIVFTAEIALRFVRQMQ